MKRLSSSKESITTKFYSLVDRAGIADLLEVKLEFLLGCLYYSKENEKYTSFEISKRNGKSRLIEAPSFGLKSLQQRFNDVLGVVYTPHLCAHGFVTGRSILSNAELHVSKKNVLNVDLMDFFPSINFGRVRGLFLSKPYSFNNEVASTLAQIVTYRGHLPQGAPTSPTISNMISKKLDRELLNYLTSKRCHYTRYADDITISTNQKRMPKEVISSDRGQNIILAETFVDIIQKNGFTVNNKKTKLSYRNTRQEVAGIVTNEKINVKREYYTELRSILYNCQKNGIYNEACKYIEKYNYRIMKKIKNNITDEVLVTSWFEQVVRGKLNYLRMIKTQSNPSFTRLASEYNKLVGKCVFDVDRIIQTRSWIEDRLFVIEQMKDVDSLYQGTGLYIGEGYILTCQHAIKNSDDCEVYTSKEIKTSNNNAKMEWKNEAYDISILKTELRIDSNHPKLKKANIKIGEKITIAGFPNYSPGSSMQWQEGKVIGSCVRGGIKFYNIDAKIIEGMSGGPVLDDNYDVIGVIIYGNKNQSDADRDLKEQHGFVLLSDLPEKYFHL